MVSFIEKRIVVEVKSVDALTNIHLAQVLLNLKLNNNRFGSLVNFNVLELKERIKRIKNGY
jgi:GxxExxY protein